MSQKYRLILKAEPTPFGKIRHLFPDGIPIKAPYMTILAGDSATPCYEADSERLTVEQAEQLGNTAFAKWAQEMSYEQAVAEVKRGIPISHVWMERIEEELPPSTLPNWMKPHPDDRVFAGNERVGDNLCSRCLQPIIECETPIMFFANWEKTWRYHGSCLGMPDWDDDAELEDDRIDNDDIDYSDDGISEEQWAGGSATALESWNDDDDDTCDWAESAVEAAMPNYGICCACGEDTDTTRNFVFMELLAPVRGAGWGCENCGLPPDGAIAVVCDKCMQNEQPIVLAIYGDYRENKRIPYHQLKPGRFEHDMTKHPESAQQEVKPQSLPTEQEFRAAFKQLAEDKQPVVMSLLNWQGWCLLTAIQLVSVHAEAKNSPTIQMAVKIGRRIEQLIVGDSPRFALTARAGWKREESSIPLEELATVMEQRGRETIELVVSKDKAWALISAIQLASRHPEYFDSSHMPIVHGVATQLQDAITEEGSVLARIADAGWDASYDQPV